MTRLAEPRIHMATPNDETTMSAAVHAGERFSEATAELTIPVRTINRKEVKVK